MLETDFRRFRFSKLNTDEFRHLKLLIFWPIFGLFFTFVERFYNVGHYYSMHCPLDDMIPFCEWFLIPYLLWFVYLIGPVDTRPRLRRRNARSVRLQAAAKPEAEASLHPALCADMHLDSVYEAAFGAGCSGGAAAVRDCLPHMLQSGTA